jgi:glycosyltransferase involved in cell wall biosynthesis
VFQSNAAILVPIFKFNSYFESTLNSILDSRPVSKVYLIIDDDMDIPESFSAIQQDKYCLLKSPKSLSGVKGIGYKLDYAIRQINADFILRMDADDIWLPGREVEQLILLEKHAIVTSEPMLINSRGALIPDFRPRVPVGNIWEPLFLLCNPVSHPSVAIRRELLERVHGYRDTYPEDLDLWLRIINSDSQIYVSDKPLIKYRRHRAQISVSSVSYSNSYSEVSEQYVILKNRLSIKSEISQSSAFCRVQNCTNPVCNSNEYSKLVREIEAKIDGSKIVSKRYRKRLAYEAIIWFFLHKSIKKEMKSLLAIFGLKNLMVSLGCFFLQGTVFRIYGVK